MIFTQIRHATCIVELGGVRFLVDPVIYPQGALNPITGGSDARNPLVGITADDIDLIKTADAVLVTHTHSDHFDPAVAGVLGKDIPVVSAEKNRKKLADAGFSNLCAIDKPGGGINIRGAEITLTRGRHGLGPVGALMGASYGFVLRYRGETVYIAGDTVWCRWVADAIAAYMPDYIVLFAGAATMYNAKITMDKGDVSRVLAAAPGAEVVANHMDAWNHCILTRDSLRRAVGSGHLYIPNDRETINFTPEDPKE